MKREIPILVVLLVLLSLPLTVLGQLDLTDQFVLLATTKTKTMQKELDEAAAAGYRILTGARTAGSEIMVVMERTNHADGNYQYLLLATTRSETLQKEISEAALEGYRVVPSTVMSKDRPFGGPEAVIILEKTPGAAQRYEYRILGTSKTSTMQKEILAATNEGFQLVAMASPSEQMAVMERSVSSGM